MKRKLLAAAIIMATSMPAMAFRTFGIPDCGEWVKQQSDSNKAWVLGYLSGINAAEPSRSDALSKVSSADQIFLWMDNYCRANPLSYADTGAKVLYKELMEKK